MESQNIPQSTIPQQSYSYPTPESQPMIQFKDMLIFVLFVSLILSILGINIFIGFGNLIQYISNLLKPILAMLGFATGTVINTTADLTSDTAKFGIDVAEGAVQNIGNLFISASDKNAIPDFKQQYNKYSASLMNSIYNATESTPISNIDNNIAHVPVPIAVPVPISVPTHAKTMDETINTPPPKYMKEVTEDESTSKIQSSTINKKSNWCLIGDYKDRRSCIEVDEMDRCLSGQIFPSQQLCMNPQFISSKV